MTRLLFVMATKAACDQFSLTEVREFVVQDEMSSVGDWTKREMCALQVPPVVPYKALENFSGAL